MADSPGALALPRLTNEEIRRYSRHLLLPEVGMEGQQRLKAARVLCVGAGGLGSPVATYLTAAGVGTIGLVDFDAVDVSNLQRQILHTTLDVGQPKVESATRRLTALNPEVAIVAHDVALSSANALSILAGYDFIVDGSDNFPTRYLVNDACVLLGKPDVYGSVFRFEGQASVFATADGPCYRCLYPEPPPPGLVPSCAEGGVLGVVPGLIGTIQATETVKLILGAGSPLVGRVLLLDALTMRLREIRLRKDPECPVCGPNPTIRELVDYEQFCGVWHEPAVPDERDITPGELKSWQDGGDCPALLDVREPQEFAINRIPGAVLIPISDLPSRVSELDASRPTVVYCRIGERSARAVALLRGLGFRDVRNLVGGVRRWVEEIDPSQPLY
jgi:molybdopterin/thiamine biosynthesis adenylyltransferase/rhodanese-related sulfurtransferase